jgi:hypothetical protein
MVSCSMGVANVAAHGKGGRHARTHGIRGDDSVAFNRKSGKMDRWTCPGSSDEIMIGDDEPKRSSPARWWRTVRQGLATTTGRRSRDGHHQTRGVASRNVIHRGLVEASLYRVLNGIGHCKRRHSSSWSRCLSIIHPALPLFWNKQTTNNQHSFFLQNFL